MAKGRPPLENQDYFKVGGSTGGRRTLARERRKLSESRIEATTPQGATPPPVKPPVSAKGAGAETIRKAQERRQAREAREVQERELDRVLQFEAQGHAAPVQADHMLPAAKATTELNDFWREVREDAGTAVRAARELYGSITGLVTIPWRLVRALRTARAEA